MTTKVENKELLSSSEKVNNKEFKSSQLKREEIGVNTRQTTAKCTHNRNNTQITGETNGPGDKDDTKLT